MTTLSWTKVALAAIGLLVFGYGMRADLPGVRWAGIAFVAAAFLLRLLRR